MPVKSQLNIEALSERNRARVLGTRFCKACAQVKPALEFQPRVISEAKRGTSYVVFKTPCKACRAAADKIARAAMRKEQNYDRTPARVERVLTLASRGYSNREIAKMIRCHYMTLGKYFQQELRLGREQYTQWRKAA